MLVMKEALHMWRLGEYKKSLCLPLKNKVFRKTKFIYLKVKNEKRRTMREILAKLISKGFYLEQIKNYYT